MNRILGTFVVTIIAAASVGCAVKRDTTRLEWYPHKPTGWVTTPGGHKRDAGPFKSLQAGFVTDAEIDQAVDAGFTHFATLFPGLKVVDKPVAINDDYALFVWWMDTWASGLEGGGEGNMYGICLWNRGDSPAAPTGSFYIVRPPGTYWEVPYSDWRWTQKPLVPALEHELLHAAIGDGAHKGPEWKILSASPRN